MSFKVPAIRLPIFTIAFGLIGLGLLLIAIAVHDTHQPQDLTTVWSCALQGDQICRSDEPIVQMEPANLFRNW